MLLTRDASQDRRPTQTESEGLGKKNAPSKWIAKKKQKQKTKPQNKQTNKQTNKNTVVAILT